MAESSSTIAEIMAAHRGLLTVKQLAGFLSLSKSRIYELVKAKRIPFLRIAGSVRFDPHVTAEWLRERAISSR